VDRHRGEQRRRDEVGDGEAQRAAGGLGLALVLAPELAEADAREDQLDRHDDRERYPGERPQVAHDQLERLAQQLARAAPACEVEAAARRPGHAAAPARVR
jgi:hypothetical protein